MNRRKFIKAIIMISGLQVKDVFAKQKMPVLFIGHGSPMNALYENKFAQSLMNESKNIPKPKSILVISAHWQTYGYTSFDKQINPRIMYDFSDFPQELYQISYPAIGNPNLAYEINQKLENKYPTVLTDNWGLDHGAWSILKHLYPKANIPVFQMSIDYSQPAKYHFELAKELQFLREQGVLIIGSGNIVHNLSYIERVSHRNSTTQWATSIDENIKSAILNNDLNTLINYQDIEGSNIGIENPDHYYPFIYALGASQNSSKISWIYEGFELGTISMRCIRWD